VIAQISLSNDPCCELINAIPQWFFLLVHVVIFLFALIVAVRSFGAGESGFGWGFSLFALAEVSYLTYHVNLTLFLFAHTISEVLVLAGLFLIAATSSRRVQRSVTAEASEVAYR
jgi:hypothetical protein